MYPNPSPELRWQWPMRFGFLDDPSSSQLQQAFEAERAAHQTLQTLTKIRCVTTSNRFEFLVISGPFEQALDRLMRSPVAIQASALVIFCDVPAKAELARLARLTNASGLLFAPSTTEPRGWYREFVWNLSHDAPIDSASPATTVFANDELRNQSRISRLLHRIKDRLKTAGEERVDIPDALGALLGIGPIGVPVRHLSKAIKHALDQPSNVLFDRESHGATWGVALDEISHAAVRAASDDTQSFAVSIPEMPAAPATRFLQANIPDPLTPKLSTILGLFIDAPRAGAVVANQAFPDNFDDNLAGHLLTAVFSDPAILEKPLVQTLYLPALGSSSTAEFALSLPEDFKRIDARITILYENRVMQTVKLEGLAGTTPTLRVEMDVRPGFGGLDQQRRFDSAIVLNHTDDGVPRATTGAGLDFATFSLQGLDKAIEQIEGRINGTAWAAEDMKSIEAAGSQDLLRYLARKGGSLYRDFLNYVPDKERLASAKYIQVVAHENASRLPIEFFYDRVSPASDAKLCPHVRDALKVGSCPNICVPDENTFCPLGFWGLSRVIEWHRFNVVAAEETRGRAFALRDAKPGQHERALPDFTSAILAASAKVDKVVADGVSEVSAALGTRFGAAFAVAASWEEWAKQVAALSPAILVLIPHTDEEDDIPTMEISTKVLPSDQLRLKHVLGPNGLPQPIVLLLGCNTDNGGLPHESFVAAFADLEAAIIVSSISKVLGRHAAPLALDFVQRLVALPRDGTRSFGEVMCELRRHALLDGPPVALVLKAYGDADWRI